MNKYHVPALLEHDRPFRLRRSCLAVPGSSPKMLEKAQELAADQVFLDLEDSVAPNAKALARANVTEAIRTGEWSDKVLVVRVNDCSTAWTFRDLLEVVSEVGDVIDCIMIPKVEFEGHVHFVDNVITQIEKENGWEVGRIGLEVQLESAAGLVHLDAIARSSSRIETLIFGPGDMSASLGRPALTVGAGDGGYGSDPWHHILNRILIAARSVGVQAIDGPFAQVHDVEAYRRTAELSAILGFDGKWVLHPSQLDPANEIYSNSQEDFERASDILDAYEYSTEKEGTGAVMFGRDMIDEATRKMALKSVQRGTRQGLKVRDVPTEIAYADRAAWREEHLS